MDQEELESTLEDAGMSPYQAEVFTNLLWLRDATVREILDSCSVPQPRIYDILQDLDNQGYIETYEEESLRARIHDPSTIVSDLTTKANEFQSAADQIEDVWEKPSLGGHKISVFGDFKQVTNHASETIANAEHSVQVASDVQTYVDLLGDLRTARENDVFVKLSLYEGTFRFNLDDVHEYFEETATVVKQRESPAPFIALVDGEDAYFGLTQSPVDDYGLLINDQAMSSMLYWYFQNSLWEIWNTIFAADTNGKDSEYVEIRRCIRDITPLSEDETVSATIYGYSVSEDRQREISGEIVETISPESPHNEGDHTDIFAGRATLIIEDGDDRYTVGGFGAILEDIKATRIIVHE